MDGRMVYTIHNEKCAQFRCLRCGLSTGLTFDAHKCNAERGSSTTWILRVQCLLISVTERVCFLLMVVWCPLPTQRAGAAVTQGMTSCGENHALPTGSKCV
jgi:hypothetical protein